MPSPRFDHLVFAVPDLQAANDALAASLGLTPIYGGEHAEVYGTCNALSSLGSRCYLEVLAPVAATTAERPPFARGVAGLPEGDVISFAVATSDLPDVHARALAAGLGVRPSKANSRVTPQGHTLRWQGLVLDHDLYRGLVPFYIDWMDSIHPSTMAPRVHWCRTSSSCIRSPRVCARSTPRWVLASPCRPATGRPSSSRW